MIGSSRGLTWRRKQNKIQVIKKYQGDRGVLSYGKSQPHERRRGTNDNEMHRLEPRPKVG